jgi:hypothetical protein
VILSTAPWSTKTKQERYERGPHQSAHEFVEFLGTEFLDFLKKGYWMLLPYDEVEFMIDVRYSPLGVVPQRERRPRVIVDYSFYFVNADTLKLAPEEAMQFGKALERLLQEAVRANPKFGHTRHYKVDISDGFYRIPLSTSGVKKLGVLLPNFPGLPPLVAFPLVLPMGWTDSPPFFCAFTETICDLANEEIRKNLRYPHHKLEDIAGKLDFEDCATPATSEPKIWQKTVAPTVSIPPPPSVTKSHQARLHHKPTAYVDVFVDDFCGEGQDSKMNPLKNQRRTLFHNIDKVFRPNEADDNPSRKEPISLSKLEKGDAAINDKKRFLGWDFQGSTQELLMAAHRRDKSVQHLQEILHHPNASRKDWERLLGELRSLVAGIPGSRGQFSLLQEALSKGRRKIKISGALRLQLETFLALLLTTDRPTAMSELVYGDPPYTGATDAAKAGMGGVWFIDEEAIVWRAPFPPAVQNKLVSYDNPTGTVTNSDLELAATIAHHHVLECTGLPTAGESTHTFCDNTPTVAWQTKGSATTTAVTADLLRHSALHQRKLGHVPRYEYLEGVRNVMADDASRLWKLTDAQLLTYFNVRYPQSKLWQMHHLQQPVHSELISLLCRKKSPTESQTSEPRPSGSTGRSGSPFVRTATSTPVSSTSATPSPSCKSSCDGSGTDALPPAVSKSQLATLRTRYAPWARRWPNWGPGTTVRTPARDG